MNDAQITARAAKAENLINDPLLAEGFENLKQAIIDRIVEAPLADKDGVHELKLMLKLLADLKLNLEAFVRDGQMIEVKIKQQKKYKFF
jgi:hypothetical protein